MMNTGTHRLVILAAAALLLTALSAVPVPPAAAAGSDITGPFSEIRQGFRDTKESVEGVGRFFKTLHSITGAVTSVIDPSAIILLLVVLFLSSGFASIGVPRGRASFTVSLIAVDSVWFLWKRSMNPESLSFLGGMVAANLYILVPYFSIIILKNFMGRRTAGLAFTVSAFIKRKILRKKIDRREALLLADSLRGESVSLAASLERDMKAGGKITVISPASVKLLGRLEETIKKIKSL